MVVLPITICMGAPSPAALLPTTAVICRLSSCPSSGTSLLPLLVRGLAEGDGGDARLVEVQDELNYLINAMQLPVPRR